MLAGTLLAGVLLYSDPSASGEPSPFAEDGPLSPFEGRHPPPPVEAPSSALWLEGHVGLKSPVGIGVAADFQPWSWLALNLGCGTRAYIAGTARLNLWSWDGYTLSVGAGYSVGRYNWSNVGWFDDSPKSHTKAWSRAEWRNLLVSFGPRTVPTGWRLYMGYTTLLNPYDYTCSIEESSDLYESLCSQPAQDRMFLIGWGYSWGMGL